MWGITKLTQIDDLTRKDHHFLTPADNIFYFGEYTSQTSWDYSTTNKDILTFKACPATSKRGRIHYKEEMIRQLAGLTRRLISPEWAEMHTWVPVPPSKEPTDPRYDDRLVRMLRIAYPRDVDIRQLVLQNGSRESAHSRDAARRLEDLDYYIDETIADPEPASVIVFDDMVTTGRSYVKMRNTIQSRFPNANVIGVFLTRRIFPPLDLEDLFADFEDLTDGQN